MFIKLKYVVCIIRLLIMIILATEFIAFLNGGITSTEYLLITQPQVDNPAGYFTVNDKYWGIGGNFQQRKMILIQNEKDTEIRFVQAEDYLNKNKCTIYYLPISKFIMKIEVPLTTTKTPQDFHPAVFCIIKY